MYILFCVMLYGIGLTDRMRNVLLKNACEMYQKSKSEKKIKTADMEGLVKTEGNYGGIGSLYGMLFSAELETEEGKTRVNFGVQTHYLEYINDVERAIDESIWIIRDHQLEEAVRWN